MSRNLSFPLRGGINITTPVNELPEGVLWAAINYECVPAGGYRRVLGYERFDGRLTPSTGANAIEREARRQAILPVTGTGPVRGVFMLRGVVYAFRDQEAGGKKLFRSTLNGWVEVPTPFLNGGGKLEVILANFYGNADNEQIYGVDGTNPAFQFDGTNFTQILTGAEPNYPVHLCEFKSHLFLAFRGGSLQHSAVGEPVNFQVIDGAGEIGVGDDIHSIKPLKGGSMGVFCRDSIRIVNGTSAQNFQLTDFSETGVKEWTVQSFFSEAIFLDKQIQMMSTTDQYGDFQSASISEPVRPLIEKSLAQFTHSFINPEKNQYYLLQSGGRMLLGTFAPQQPVGYTTLRVPVEFVVGGNFEDQFGNHVIFLGGQDGYVYQFGVGTSFDGAAIDSLLQFAPNHVRSLMTNKRFRKVTLESDRGFKGLYMTADFDYARGVRGSYLSLDASVTGALYDIDLWNQCTWSTGIRNYSEIYIEGHGRNISLYIYHVSDIEKPYTLDLITLSFDFRKNIR